MSSTRPANVVVAALLCAALTSFARPAWAVLQTTGTRNTSDPGDNSGWQYQGTWGQFLGTPIGPDLFITANHVQGFSGPAGTHFNIGGDDFTTVAKYRAIDFGVNADLTIWRIDGQFDSGQIAPLYTGSEIGKQIAIFGRGAPTSGAVTVLPGVGGSFKGWQWGTPDGQISWGRNIVGGFEDYAMGDQQLLRYDFTTGLGAVTNEAGLVWYDSGGGVFIRQGVSGPWQLAAINYGADAYYSYVGGADTGFGACLIDKGGLYEGSVNNWTLLTDDIANHPTSSYSTRLTTGAVSGWISSIMNLVYGDLNADTLIDADDVDLLYDYVDANNPLGNLNGDGVTSQLDVDYLISTVLGTQYGDADLDQDVDGADFDAWRIRNSLGDPIGWATGDWDGDDDVDGNDFDLWRLRPTAIGGQAPTVPSFAAVPEPSTLVLLVLAVPAILQAARRAKCQKGPKV